jgi:hypothetical protein
MSEELTGLYIPLTDFKIKEQDGFKILYNHLIKSGPAYRLIVHESNEWYKIKDQIENPEQIIILDSKEANHYKELSLDFFAPITQAAPYYKDEKGNKCSMLNLAMDLRRALSYILIAHDYKARIYDDDILDYFNPIGGLEQNHFSEDSLNRVRFVDCLLKGYKKSNIPSISVNQNNSDFKTVRQLLESIEIRELSLLNYCFGEVQIRKNLLVDQVRDKVEAILHNSWFPYVLSGATLGLSYCLNLADIRPALIFLAGISGHALGKIKFEEYIPPIEDPKLFALDASGSMGLISYSSRSFNNEYTFLIER